MKKIIFTACMAIITISCAKNITAAIPGKWSNVNEIEWYTDKSSGITAKDTMAYNGSYTSDFRPDGFVYQTYESFGSSAPADTFSYKLKGDSISFGIYGDNTYIIETPASNTLTLYARSDNPSSTYQYWVNYTRY